MTETAFGVSSRGRACEPGDVLCRWRPTRLFRIDDGGHYHGYDGPGVWALDPKGTRTQGLLYGIEDGAIISAGYLIRQADLAAGKSFHGLTLRELDLPVAHAMTIDLIEGGTADDNQYLWLWHFTPPEGTVQPMLATGQLPSATSLPSGIHRGRVRPYSHNAFLSGHGAALYRHPGYRPDVQSSTDRDRR